MTATHVHLPKEHVNHFFLFNACTTSLITEMVIAKGIRVEVVGGDTVDHRPQLSGAAV